MPFNLQIYLNYVLVILALAAGLVGGMLAGRMIHLTFSGEQRYQLPAEVQPLAVRQLQEEDLQVIINRSLFDVDAIGAEYVRPDLPEVAAENDTVQVSARSENLTLLGTVVAGEYSLALINTGNEVKVFGLGSEIGVGVTVDSIERRRVVVLERGERRELLLVEDQAEPSRPATRRAAAATATSTASQNGVVDLGEGRFRVDRGMVDSARGNMGALLQSARMIPHMENGQTTGFRLVGMQRGSLLEQLGLRLGDVVVEINQVKLDSPEKALQIFQQVREANNISLGLIRNGEPQTFEYSLD
ncbi:MAG TPA: type II secretion system protein GspC [Pelovirga sp.]|nr:type II secretion system protein GspC [Pelovirga sp.]